MDFDYNSRIPLFQSTSCSEDFSVKVFSSIYTLYTKYIFIYTLKSCSWKTINPPPRSKSISLSCFPLIANKLFPSPKYFLGIWFRLSGGNVLLPWNSFNVTVTKKVSIHEEVVYLHMELNIFWNTIFQSRNLDLSIFFI